MKFLPTVIVLALVGQTIAFSLTSPTDDDLSWRSYKKRFGKSYDDPSEDLMRKGLFLRNKVLVEQHNAKLGANGATFTRELNKYADWTHDEMQILNGLRKTGSQDEVQYKTVDLSSEKYKHKRFSRAGAANELGWNWANEKFVVGPVQDQGKCGSDYAFAATGLIEALEYGSGIVINPEWGIVKLSDQNIVDCSRRNHGCDGGSIEAALLDVEYPHGIESAANYPYVGKQEECQFDENEKILSTFQTYKEAKVMNETRLGAFVENQGPQTTSIDGTNLHLYKGGLFNDCDSSGASNNHAVLITGWGKDPKEGPYWILKNSWGADWGEKGYFRMPRGKGMCGIGADVVFVEIL